jgi:lysophospholipase L1-like esterase
MRPVFLGAALFGLVIPVSSFDPGPSITNERPVIVALGDSTTAGTPGFRSPLEAPPDGAGDIESQYAYWLMKAHPEWTVLNRGVNAQRSDEIRARFETSVTADAPDLVIIIAGVNDVYQGREPAWVQQQLQAMYARAKALGVPVIAGSIIPYNTATPDQNARMRAINEWIRRTAEGDPNVTFVDTRAAVAAATDPDRLASSPDQLHPDARGYRQMAEALEPVIARLVTRSRPMAQGLRPKA